MEDVERLLGAFADGRLIRPSAEQANIVDLAHGLALVAGAPRQASTTAAADRIADRIGPAEHLLFVLVDGLGVGMLERLESSGFLRTHLAEALHSVFPSTTAAALSSVMSGWWPARHCIPGWWVHLEEIDRSVNILPFRDRTTGEGLEEHGLRGEAVFGWPPLVSTYGRDCLSLIPDEIAGSAYSYASFGSTPQQGYAGVDEAFRLIIRRVQGAPGPTFTYLYLAEVDDLAHATGPGSEQTITELEGIESRLALLQEALQGEARLVVCADHGQIDRPLDRMTVLDDSDPLIRCLRFPPTGEPVVPIFHVLPGRQREFEELFRSRLGEWFCLLRPQEVEEMGLMGPEPLGEAMFRRLGDLVGVATEPADLRYHLRGRPRHIHLGIHAGLTPAEMLVPLIVA